MTQQQENGNVLAGTGAGSANAAGPDGQSVRLVGEQAFRRGAEAMREALADALRDHLNSRAAAIANTIAIPEYRL